MAVDIALVRELAKLLTETDLSEIEVEDEDRRIRVARGGSTAAVQHVVAAPAPAPVAAAPAAPVAAAPAAAPAAGGDSHGDAVKSPMVGTAYLSPDPASPVFKAVGDAVKEGDTILIIEAMKVMNNITAPRGGTLKAMHVANAQPVEFDQPLFTIG